MNVESMERSIERSRSPMYNISNDNEIIHVENLNSRDLSDKKFKHRTDSRHKKNKDELLLIQTLKKSLLDSM